MRRSRNGSRAVPAAGTRCRGTAELEDLALAKPGHDGPDHDLREADDCDESVGLDLAVVELAEEAGHLVGAADLGVVVLNLPRRQLAERLHLDLVDHRVEDVLARAEADTAEDAYHHALLVLPGLVAEPDRGRLPTGPKLVGDERRVEVEGVHRGGESASYTAARWTCARVSSSGEVQPSRHSASVSSSRRSSSPLRTP